MNIDMLFYILAAIFLGLDTFGVSAGVKWFSAAALCLVLSLIV